jgi:hypothetical protein
VHLVWFVIGFSPTRLREEPQGGYSKEHLPYYLDEFTFRFNRRTSKARGLLFYRLVTQAVRTPHIDTDALFRATGRGRRSRRGANHNG